MGLSLIDFNPDAVIGRIEQIGNRAIKHGSELMAKEGEEIAKLAREFAPVDQGDLEAAIKSEVVADAGRNRRNVVLVYVDPDARDEHGRSVLAYGSLLHSEQIPEGGVFGLGPKSEAKDAGRGVVGGGFLSRAFAIRAKTIESKLRQLWIRQFGTAGSRGGRG